MSDPRTPPPSDPPPNPPRGEHRADTDSTETSPAGTPVTPPTSSTSGDPRAHSRQPGTPAHEQGPQPTAYGGGTSDDNNRAAAPLAHDPGRQPAPYHRDPDRASDQESTATLPVTDRDDDGVADRDEREATSAVPPGTAAPVAVSDHRQAQQIRREEFGGFNVGADMFGWLVAVALTVLITGIVGAAAAAVGESLNVDRTDAEREANTFGLATAIALLVILMLAYYAGGYVAGRMSRFDGGRQGLGVWLIGLLVTLIAVGVGVLTSSQYNIVDRVDLPSFPIPSDSTLTSGGLITLAAVLVGTLIAAFAGGKVGQRFHTKVDRVGLRNDRE